MKPSLLDRAIAAIAPSWAVSRVRARHTFDVLSRAYDAAAPSRLRKQSKDYGSGNAVAGASAKPLRDMARQLDRNSDTFRHALNILVNNTVGAGIGVHPQPRMPDGTVDVGLARQLEDLWSDFMEQPEVTAKLDGPAAQRLLARSWFRDGEVLYQHLIGPVALLDHGTVVPYSIELLEADMLSMESSQPSAATRVVNGVELSAWGRPVAYQIYKGHPAEGAFTFPQIKRVAADRIVHGALIDRIGQVRGVSVAASVMTRLEDIKDYEESERIAAKIAASIAAVIKKGDPAMYGSTDTDASTGAAERMLSMAPGMIFDDLRPGESVEVIDSSRPSAGFEPFIKSNLKRAAGGLMVSNSAFSKDYDGTYSAQRQELVEQYLTYKVIQDEFISRFIRPMYRSFVQAALLGGQIRLPAGMERRHLANAMFVGPQMPWIDPLKEVLSLEVMEERGWISGDEIIRRRGGNPEQTLQQAERWRDRAREAGFEPSPSARAARQIHDQGEDNVTQLPRGPGRIRASGKGPTIAPLLRVQAMGSDSAEVLIYGDIGEDWWGDGRSTSAADFVAKLNALSPSVRNIKVRINSVGGSVSDALAIHNVLRAHPATIQVDVEGVAFSAASLIAMAGDTVRMYPASLLMVHAPWTYAGGDAASMRDVADQLDTYADAMATAYARKTGKPLETVRGLLADGTDHYFTGEEAVAEGFADELVSDAEQPAEETAASPSLASLSRYRAAGAYTSERIAAAARRGVSAIPAQIPTPTASQPEEPEMKFKKHRRLQDPAGSEAGAPGGAAPAPVAAVALQGVADRNVAIRAALSPLAANGEIAALQLDALADPTITLEQVNARALAIMARGASSLTTPRVEAGVDQRDRNVQAAVGSLLLRAGRLNGEPAAQARNGNPFQGMRMLDLARACVEATGQKTQGWDQNRVVATAITHGTSDFPVILENTMNKLLVAAYTATVTNWRRFCRIGSLSDFRPHNRLYSGSFSTLATVQENAEIPAGTLTDGEKQVITGLTKGRILPVSRQMIINDDLGAFTSVTEQMGRAAARTVDLDVFSLFALNGGFGPTMSDSQPLFHSSHNNIAGVAAAPGMASFDAARVLLGSQVGPGAAGSTDVLGLTPALWLGPLGLEGQARATNGAEYDPDGTGRLQRPNIVRGLFRETIGTARLAGTPWYVLAEPGEEPVFEVAFLDGNDLPVISQDAAISQDGINFRVLYDYGVAAVGWRGAVRNAGA